MQRISSNMTLAYKIFFPTFWYVFMGLLTTYIVFADPETTPLFNTIQAKAIFVVVFLFFAFLIYRSFVILLRMEIADTGIYMSNYFKTYRYNIEDIESISTSKFLFFRVLRIRMKQKTSLGKSFKVLYKEIYWSEVLDTYPLLKSKIP